MTKIFERINDIVAEWDPIGVGAFIAPAEYRAYIPGIINRLHDRAALKAYLEHILVKMMGLAYNPENDMHRKDIENICNRLMQVKENE